MTQIGDWEDSYFNETILSAEDQDKEEDNNIIINVMIPGNINDNP